MRQLRYRRAARQDIVEIARYLAEGRQAPHAARKVRGALIKACLRRAESSLTMGRQRNDLRPGLRSVLHRPYIIFFTYPDADTLEIARVLHGARDLPAIFQREG